MCKLEMITNYPLITIPRFAFCGDFAVTVLIFQFAKSAKLMKNKPIINEVMNDKAIISKYEKRIRYKLQLRFICN